MKINFKKISAVMTSALMVGLTLGVATAANYPNPFVVGGVADVGIVYGTGSGVSDSDQVQAYNINLDLQDDVTSGESTTTVTGGDAKSLASGSDYLYLNDELGENIQTLTNTELGTVLADGTFTDDGGTSYDYEQTIAIGSSSDYNKFEFGNSDNDYDDPLLMLDLETTSGREVYNLTVTFSKAVNFTAADSEGEKISLFGKEYTVGSATDDNTLVLLGGASATKLTTESPTASLTIDDKTFEVTLIGLSSDTTTKAGIDVTYGGETIHKTPTQGQTKTCSFDDGTEVDLYADTVFRTGDTGTGYVEIQLGADKLTLETTSNVQTGSEDVDIDGTLVYMTPSNSLGMQNLTKMVIAVVAPDNDENDVLVGESFVDPVFGTMEIQFKDVVNGPVFTGEEDTERTALKLVSGGDRELQLTLTDKNGYTKTIPFAYKDTLKDDNSDLIKVGEGQALDKDSYFILNSGNYEHFMQITKLSVDADGVADDDITFKDIITGTSYDIVDKNLGYGNQSTTITINSQVYTVATVGAINTTYINVTSSDFALKEAVYPYIELVSGEDYPRVALTDTVVVSSKNNTMTAATNNTYKPGKIYELPTGSLQFQMKDYANITNGTTVQYRVDGGTWTTVAGISAAGISEDAIAVNEGVYDIWTTVTDPASGNPGFGTLVINNFSVDSGLDTTDVTDNQDSPGILFVENKDKSDADAKNVIFINTTDDGSTYSELQSIAFSSTALTGYDEQAWDETKLTGYLTNWGTYVLKDQTDTNQYLARLTYPDTQMYAEVYFAEVGASITGGVSGSKLGNVVYKDTETSSYSTKNVIVVGGSCINSAAASLVGGAYCTSDWTDATGVGSGEFLIKGYASSDVTSKFALLVAGYDIVDTANAATYLINKKPDTSKAWKGTTSTAAATEITEA
ncbi:MAG: hypothetical protein WCX73_03215 [Candidatus Pacearchaeota archaeon]|jgi:hypothetical protein